MLSVCMLAGCLCNMSTKNLLCENWLSATPQISCLVVFGHGGSMAIEVDIDMTHVTHAHIETKKKISI